MKFIPADELIKFEKEIGIMFDVFYSDGYGRINEIVEEGIFDKFSFVSEGFLVIHLFIKRPVPWFIDGKQYYDIITPYGYGGPLIVNSSMQRNDIMDEFRKAFGLYCHNNNIICEFVRFHPLLNNAEYCDGVYDPILNRKTIAIDLSDNDLFNTQFDSKCRNKIRKAQKLFVYPSIDYDLLSIDAFMNMYYMTMKKNQAADYYFFKKEYFYRLRDELHGSAIIINALYDDQIIASSLFFFSPGNYAYYHLSATNPDYNSYGANNLILYEACKLFAALGCTQLHLGGGLTSDQGDQLMAFKKSFGREDRNMMEFYIGKRIWNECVYEKVMKVYLDNGGKRNSYFPEYRTKEALINSAR